MPLPPDIVGVLDVFQKLGDAARRGLHMAEQVSRRQIHEASRRAKALAERLHR